MSCNTCFRNPCSCLAGVPQPFYAQSSACAQDHTKNVYIQQISLGLQIQSAWNIPSCGSSAVLSVPGLTAASVGSTIWHESYGYFEIIAYDVIGQTITIQNNCTEGNAAPGTQVASCTTFTISPPPCCSPTTDGVFVAIDFTAPDVDDCIDITLTSTEGLISGYGVSIGSGVYVLQEVKANNIVTICNDGEGIVPGTSVIAQDYAGNYQYPVTVVSTNPCSQDTTNGGAVLVCRDGFVRPLAVPEVPVLLVGTNVTGNIATYEVVGPGLEFDGNILQVDPCLEQAIYTEIALQQFSFTPTIVDGVSENDLGIIKSIGVPAPGCTYAYEAILQIETVAAQVNFQLGPDPDDPNYYANLWQHEAALHWDEDGLPYESKHVWNHNGPDVFPDPIPGAARAIQKEITGISAGGGYWYMNYHACMVNCVFPSVAAGSVPSVNLRLKYRTAQGEFNLPDATGQVNVLVYGVVRVLRV